MQFCPRHHTCRLIDSFAASCSSRGPLPDVLKLFPKLPSSTIVSGVSNTGWLNAFRASKRTSKNISSQLGTASRGASPVVNDHRERMLPCARSIAGREVRRENIVVSKNSCPPNPQQSVMSFGQAEVPFSSKLTMPDRRLRLNVADSGSGARQNRNFNSCGPCNLST